MSMNDKNILITGISGFVGSCMAKYLLNEGANVYGLIRRRADGLIPYNLQKLNIIKEIKLIEGNLENIASIGYALHISNPDFIFHFGAQSFVPRSFIDPLETIKTNCCGTSNLLETIRIRDFDPIIVFAGSSEEYGLVISSQLQYESVLQKYGTIFPEPIRIPEIPIIETNPLRPMSPYAVSKVFGDYIMRNYYHSYGIKTIISRAFNHEGAGRGIMFVTSIVASQVMKLKFGEAENITIGNVNALRDWSHISDAIDGYILLAEKGKYGDVYNQGSMRTNSVISYILLSLEEAGYHVTKIETFQGDKLIENPIEPENSDIFGIRFDKTKIDEMIMHGELYFTIEDGGIIVSTDSREIKIIFDPERFRQVEVPILLSENKKIKDLGFKVKHSVNDIIKDQLNNYLSERNRKGSY